VFRREEEEKAMIKEIMRQKKRVAHEALMEAEIETDMNEL